MTLLVNTSDFPQMPPAPAQGPLMMMNYDMNQSNESMNVSDAIYPEPSHCKDLLRLIKAEATKHFLKCIHTYMSLNY